MSIISAQRSALWICLLAAVALPLPRPAHAANAELLDVVEKYAGTAEQNAVIWRNLGDFREMGGKVPKNVLEGFNQYRVGVVNQVRAETAKQVLAGTSEAKALGGFINTGSWTNPKNAAFKATSDIDFTIVGRNHATVNSFYSEFYKNLGDRLGITARDLGVHADATAADKIAAMAKSLDVNAYTVGGNQAGAYRTPGGRRFFEVYSVQTGGSSGYQQIVGVGGDVRVVNSHIDNAFYDIGQKVPKFPPDAARSFLGEINGMARQISAPGQDPGHAVKDMAKLTERAHYSEAVLKGQVYSITDLPQVVKEARELKRGGKLVDVLKSRIDSFIDTGFSPERAETLARSQFLNESEKFIKAAAAGASNTLLETKSAGFDTFKQMLKTAGTGAKYGAYAGVGALSAYMLYSSYQEHGKEGLFKELVAQGLGWSFPPVFVAQLAGIAVKASGEYGLDLVKQYKEDAAYRSLLGTSYGDLIKAWEQGNEPPKELVDLMGKFKTADALKTFLDREWNESLQFSAIGSGVQADRDKVRKDLETTFLGLQKGLLDYQKAEKEMLAQLQQRIAAEEKALRDQLAKDDPDQQAALVAADLKQMKFDLPEDNATRRRRRQPTDSTPQEAGQPRLPEIKQFAAAPAQLQEGDSTRLTLSFQTFVGGKVEIAMQSPGEGRGPASIVIEAKPGDVITRNFDQVFPAAGNYTVTASAADSAGIARTTVKIAVAEKMKYDGRYSGKAVIGAKVSEQRPQEFVLEFVVKDNHMTGTALPADAKPSKDFRSRLAVIMHRIWVDGTEFRWTREQAAAAA